MYKCLIYENISDHLPIFTLIPLQTDLKNRLYSIRLQKKTANSSKFNKIQTTIGRLKLGLLELAKYY